MRRFQSPKHHAEGEMLSAAHGCGDVIIYSTRNGLRAPAFTMSWDEARELADELQASAKLAEEEVIPF